MQIKKAITILLASLFLLFLSINALASAEITYNFYNQQNQKLDNVNFLVYTCLDSTCSNVKTPVFTGSNNYGNSNDYPPNTDLVVTFPTTLENRYGYALYYYRDGYLPMEYFANWAGNGATNYDVVFEKKASCSSHVEDFRIINADNPNLPIQIKVKTKLDANTYSAFQSNPNTPEYVPGQYRDYYSAETKVTLKIYNENDQVIFERTTTLNLYMDSSEEVNFEWIPQKAGDYKAEIKTEVIDNQCSSQIPQSAISEFTVVTNSLDKCYTLLNNLRTSVVEPYVNENVEIKANKITNYRYGNGSLKPLSTEVKLKILDTNNNIIKQETKLINANPDVTNPVEFMFNWIPEAKGLYTIEVNGIAKDPLCEGKENLDETESINTLVKETPNNIYLNLETISNKKIDETSDVNFIVNADYNGRKELTFTAINVPEDASFNSRTREFKFNPDYDTVSHNILAELIEAMGLPIYKDFEITFKVTDGSLTDYLTVKIRVYDVNRNPELNEINDITVYEGQLVKVYAVATDADNDDVKISYNAPLNRNGEWQTRLGNRGTYFATITARDNFDGKETKTIKITVLANGDNNVTVADRDSHKLRTTSLYLENEVVRPGEYLIVNTRIRNDGSEQEDNVKLRITIPELGIIEQLTIDNFDNNEQLTRTFMIKMPYNAESGYYALKATVFNQKSSETELVEFKVV